MKLRLTAHARWRAREMGIPAKQIKTILDRIDLDYPSDQGDYRVAVAENIAVPYSPDGYAITVLWRGQDGRELPERSVRVGER